MGIRKGFLVAGVLCVGIGQARGQTTRPADWASVGHDAIAQLDAQRQSAEQRVQELERRLNATTRPVEPLYERTIWLDAGSTTVLLAPIQLQSNLAIRSRSVAGVVDRHARLLFRPEHDGQDIITGGDCHNVLIEGVRFEIDTAGGTSGNAVEVSNVRNLVIRNSEFRTCGYAVLLRNVAGLVFTGNRQPGVGEMSGYFLYAENLRNAVVSGNSASDSTKQALMRFHGFSNLTITDNELSDNHNYRNACLRLHEGQGAYVARNRFGGAGIGMGPLGGTDGAREDPQRVKWTREVVCESNQFDGATVGISAGTTDIVVRDNWMTGGRQLVHITPHDRHNPHRFMENVHVLRNRGTMTGVHGSAISIWHSNPGPRGLYIEGNELATPNLITGEQHSAILYVDAESLEGMSFKGNTWSKPAAVKGYAEGGVMYLWPSWSDPKGYLTPAEWEALPQVEGDRFVEGLAPENH